MGNALIDNQAKVLAIGNYFLGGFTTYPLKYRY